MNFNSASILGECVRSLAREEIARIVIVNNSPTEAERNLLSRILESSSNVEIIEASGNIGFGPAVNLAVRTLDLSSQDRVWLVNPDVLVTTPGTALTLSAVLDDGYGIASPSIVTDGAVGQIVWYGGGTYERKSGCTIHWHHGADPQVLSGTQKGQTVSFVSGAAMMLTGKTWLALGGFREDLFLYWEDAELCLRAIEEAIPLAVLPSVSVWHKVGASSSSAGKSSAYFYFMNRNRLIVASQYVPWSSLLVGPGTAWTFRFLIRAARSPQPFSKVWAAFRGIYDGVSGARKQKRAS